MRLLFEECLNEQAKIKVIGVGGGGGNAINTMVQEGLKGVDFIAANTDAQALRATLAPMKIQMGMQLTKGLGAGANPEIGRNAALEAREQLREVLAGTDLVFITAGLGGGTGTGGAPIVAQVARENGSLTVAVVTKPFAFEGKKRQKQAEAGFTELKKAVDTIVTVPNERVLSYAGKNLSILEAFALADQVLLQGVKGITGLITTPGLINLDFADIKTIMTDMGLALLGTGTARGEHRAVEAAQAAVSCPLLEDVTIRGAKGVLINICGSRDLTLSEVAEAASLIHAEAHEDANIIFGAVIDEELQDEARVTVIATGFDVPVDQPLTDFAGAGANHPPKKDDLEVPAYLRRDSSRGVISREKTLGAAQGPALARVGSTTGRDPAGRTAVDKANYNIPAFLRKAVD